MKTDEELAHELKVLILEFEGDPEICHGEAEDYIIKSLESIGYKALAKVFKDAQSGFWYA